MCGADGCTGVIYAALCGVRLIREQIHDSDWVLHSLVDLYDFTIMGYSPRQPGRGTERFCLTKKTDHSRSKTSIPRSTAVSAC